jgi:hypothetical protein
MLYEQLGWCNELADLFGEAYDTDYMPIWHAEWSDYEEWGWIYILEKDGRFYEQTGGYSVMSSDNTPYWAPREITYEEMCEILDEWHEIETRMNACIF